MNNKRNIFKLISALGLLDTVHDYLGVQSVEKPKLTWYATGNGGIEAAGPKPSAQAWLEIHAC